MNGSSLYTLYTLYTSHPRWRLNCVPDDNQCTGDPAPICFVSKEYLFDQYSSVLCLYCSMFLQNYANSTILVLMYPVYAMQSMSVWLVVVAVTQ